MSELTLGAVVLIVAAVPLALLVLFWTDILPTTRWATLQRWRPYLLIGLSVVAIPAMVVRIWGWAGAAHLEPLCQAYARPEIFNTTARDVQRLVWWEKGSGQSDMPSQRRLPPWTSAVSLPIHVDNSSALSPTDTSTDDTLNDARSARLEVERIVHHRNFFFEVQLDRVRILSADGLEEWGIADELWLEAGPYRYHCGVESGPYATNDTRYPNGDGIARFIQSALSGKPQR